MYCHKEETIRKNVKEKKQTTTVIRLENVNETSEENLKKWKNEVKNQINNETEENVSEDSCFFYLKTSIIIIYYRT